MAEEQVTFRAVVELGGRMATGIAVTPDVVDRLGGGKRPAVVVALGPYTCRTTVGSMGGRAMVPLGAENRTAAEVAAGDEVEVGIALDQAPRTVEVPEDLAALLSADSGAGAKKAETRAERVVRTVEALAAGRRTR